MTKEIIFISAPLCPKCVRVKRWLSELESTNPEINIVKLNIVTNTKETKQYQIKTIPTLIVGDVRLGGWIKEEEFQEALKKL
ncbi:MAG: thioredoxin family protein [Candidatus Heimdallarchaeota archaeon]|nr:thioredoxin family protein [Candidatus Heimdallarchaeota archaeon]